MKIINYLYELKKYFIYNVLLIFLIFTLNFFYFNELLYILLKPLLMSINYLIFTNLTDIFFIYIKIYLISIFYFYVPLFIFQLNKFLRNGLYSYEQELIKYMSFSFLFFFILNNILIYFFLIPSIWNFFLNFEILSNIELFNLYFEGKINDYFLLIFKLLININLCLNIPFFLIFLNYFNIISINLLIKQRKFNFFLLLCILTIFSPPDIISFFFLLIFMYIFYEFTIFILYLLNHYKNYIIN